MKPMAGFTLLEVMVALAIFAVAAIALTQVGMRYSQTVAGMQERSIAHWLLMNEVAQMRIDQAWPEGSADRDVQWNSQAWRIHWQVYPTPASSVRRMEMSASKLEQGQVQGDAVQRLVWFVQQPSTEAAP